MKNKTLTEDGFPFNINGDFKPAITHVRCPKCRSSDLWLTEFVSASTAWEIDGGRLNLSAGAHEIQGQDDKRNMVGDCRTCGHVWRLRKANQITDVVTELDPETFEPL